MCATGYKDAKKGQEDSKKIVQKYIPHNQGNQLEKKYKCYPYNYANWFRYLLIDFLIYNIPSQAASINVNYT